jgi:hypothetical protein
METQQITVDREEARALWRKYREHQHYSTPVDDDIRRTYDALGKGKIVIQALASIVAAGLGEDGLPKLAIIRADAPSCHLYMRPNGAARFATKPWARDDHRRTYIDLPAGSFPDARKVHQHFAAITPLVPVHQRPQRALENYHILFEAEWRRVVPKDPLLLRRIGEADLWVVSAAWDLTEIERAVLSSRVALT